MISTSLALHVSGFSVNAMVELLVSLAPNSMSSTAFPATKTTVKRVRKVNARLLGIIDY